MTTQEKLHQLRMLKDPHYASSMAAKQVFDMATLIKGEPGPEGKPGKTPQKGVDYYTQTDVTALISHIRSLVKDGKDSTVPGPQGKSGKPGADGISPDQEAIIRAVLQQIPKPQDGISPKTEDLVAQVVTQLEKTKKKVSIRDIHDLNELIDFLKLGGFRGGGSSTGGTTTNFVDNEVVSGSGTSWTLVSVPVVGSEHLFANGQRLIPGGVDYTISGKIITTINSWATGTVLADYRK